MVQAIPESLMYEITHYGPECEDNAVADAKQQIEELTGEMTD